MRSNALRNVQAGIAALALSLIAGCNGTNSVLNPTGGGGGTSNLTVTNASPSDGNGTLDNPTITYETNQGVDQLDVVRLSQTVGSTGHEIEIYWLPATGEVRSVQHAWGPAAGGATSGFTGCFTGMGGTPCDPAKVAVAQSSKTITCMGLVLADMFGGTTTSTVSGTVHWQ